MTSGFALLRRQLINISMGDLHNVVHFSGRDEVAGLLKGALAHADGAGHHGASGAGGVQLGGELQHGHCAGHAEPGFSYRVGSRGAGKSSAALEQTKAPPWP